MSGLFITFNFTLSGLETARASLARIDDCLARLREAAGPADLVASVAPTGSRPYRRVAPGGRCDCPAASEPLQAASLRSGRGPSRACTPLGVTERSAELKSKGWLVEDTPKGARLKRLHP